MVGCRHNAKNTLDKNYLYFAERRGVRIIAETEVRAIRELAGGGYELDTVAMGGLFFKRRGTLRCRGIVAAAGVLGTVPLLMKCKLRGSLSRVSSELGRFVRTNSEALVGSTSRERGVDYSKGVAIASGFRPDEQTEIEMCRYGDGQDLLSLLCTLLVPGGPPWPRWLRFLGEVIRRPLTFARLLNPIGWARCFRDLARHAIVTQPHEPAAASSLVLAIRQTFDFPVGYARPNSQIHTRCQ